MFSTAIRDLKDLPKAHLHLHFEGAMRPSTLSELCQRHNVPLPTLERRVETFAAFQARYVAAQRALHSREELTRLTREVAEDAAADGARWIEISVNLLKHRDVASHAGLLEILVTAGVEAAATTGVGIGWLVTVDRTESPEDALEQARIAADFAGRGVVGFGLANDETKAPPQPFEEAFAVAKSAGLLCAPHAGEHSGPESVRDALDILLADRIQHGVLAQSDPVLLARLAKQRVCLDVCPTSNVLLSVVANLESHPLPKLLAAGVPCSTNADDPLLFGVGLLDEYELCRVHLGLDDAMLAACARDSFEYSGAPPATTARAKSDIDGWLGLESVS